MNGSHLEFPSRNIYVDTKEFVSAKKVAVETPGCENLQLISFHSTSKGLIGEVIMNIFLHSQTVLFLIRCP